MALGLRKQRPKDELQMSQRPHIRADHLRYEDKNTNENEIIIPGGSVAE